MQLEYQPSFLSIITTITTTRSIITTTATTITITTISASVTPVPPKSLPPYAGLQTCTSLNTIMHRAVCKGWVGWATCKATCKEICKVGKAWECKGI
jgi:hypothetical protein